jgi:hypothetical protein
MGDVNQRQGRHVYCIMGDVNQRQGRHVYCCLNNRQYVAAFSCGKFDVNLDEFKIYLRRKNQCVFPLA